MTINNNYGKPIYGNVLSPTSGKTTVTTAGTRVALTATHSTVNGVYIKALSTNTGLVYIGDATVASTNGFQLSAKEQVQLFTGDITNIYIDSAVNGEGVCYIQF